MNKKLIYIFAVLVIGLFVVSACSSLRREEVGAIGVKKTDGGVVKVVNPKTTDPKISANSGCTLAGAESDYNFKCTADCGDGRVIDFFMDDPYGDDDNDGNQNVDEAGESRCNETGPTPSGT